jgi:hypothetical protein
MTDKYDLLWNIYQEHCNWERHHENQRSSVTNILIAVAAGVLGIIALDGKLAPTDLPLTIFLIIQGVFGSIFVAKQYERFARHQRLANKYRQELNDGYLDAKIVQLRKEGDIEQERQYKYLSKLRLHQLWVYLHLSFAIFGLVLTIIIIGQK